MTSLHGLRLVAFIEGVSFLVLLFVSSIVPFGTSAFDVSLRREIAAAARAEG